MATAKLPLLSAAASGSLGRYLTFARRGSRNQVRYQRKQTDVHTDNQICRRLLIAQGVANWQAFSPAQKAVFNDLAKGHSMSGYNLYLQGYLSTATPPEARSIFGSRTYGYYEYGRQVLA